MKTMNYENEDAFFLWSKWWQQLSMSASVCQVCELQIISVSASQTQVIYVGVGVKTCISSGWIRKKNWIRLSGGVNICLIISHSTESENNTAPHNSQTQTPDEQTRQMQAWTHERADLKAHRWAYLRSTISTCSWSKAGSESSNTHTNVFRLSVGDTLCLV